MMFLRTIVLVLSIASAGCDSSHNVNPNSSTNDGSLGLFTGDVKTACGSDGPSVEQEFAFAAMMESHSGSANIRWVWCDSPKSEEYVRARMQLIGLNSLSADALVVDPQMPSMGHGTYVDEQLIGDVVGAANTYDVSGIYFIMGGDWEIYVTAAGERFTVPVVVESSAN